MTIVTEQWKDVGPLDSWIGGIGETTTEEALDNFRKIDKTEAKVLVFRRKGNRKLKVIIVDSDGAMHVSYAVYRGDRRALAPLIAEAMKHATPRKDGDEARIRIKRLPLAQLAATSYEPRSTR